MEVDAIQAAAEALASNISQYAQLQTEEFSDTFELVFKLNQAAVGKYGELVQEAALLKQKARLLQEQEIGIASFLGNLSVIEQDIVKLEQAMQKLETYVTLLEQKAAKTQ
jgi:biogenesis of lysosome-related organelles complex 1 subunit 2